jgi:transposase
LSVWRFLGQTQANTSLLCSKKNDSHSSRNKETNCCIQTAWSYERPDSSCDGTGSKVWPLPSPQNHNVYHIHIDEKSRRGHDYVSIIYADDGTVLEVVGGRKREDAKRLINKALNPIQQANVLTLTIDMWDNFRDAALELMPQVRICHDPYHLVGHLQDAVDSVRRREVKGNDILKRSRFLFLKDLENLTAKEQIRFDFIVKTNLEVANAWRIKEEFRDIVKAKSEHAQMFILYLIWRQRAKAAHIPEITKVIDMFDRHERGILNALKLDKSNGRAERMNGSIQELKTIGRGYRDVERFRIAILFFHGGLKLHRDL